MRCPDNDRRLAIVELLDNALTKRFTGKKLGIPPNSNALSFEIFGKISCKFNIRLRVADKYVSHPIRFLATRDDWTANILLFQVRWQERRMISEGLWTARFGNSLTTV